VVNSANIEKDSILINTQLRKQKTQLRSIEKEGKYQLAGTEI
jgi:hypothetical protein